MRWLPRYFHLYRLIASIFKFIIFQSSFIISKHMESRTEQEISEIRNFLKNWKIDEKQELVTNTHHQYINWIIHKLGEYIIHFQNAQPWLHYYVVHSFRLLSLPFSQSNTQKMIKALKYCRNEGFAGGYNQLDHLAPTYAAFIAILELGQPAYPILDRQDLYKLFCKLKKGNRFMMHEHGQCDLRASYIVTLIVKSLKLPEDVLDGIAQGIIASQTHEGGIANVIGGEAHGGFTFCGIAALALMGRLQQIDVSKLVQWLSQRQVQFGGFNGRTNKLIDSCYSFWVGAVFNIINNYFDGKMSFQNHLLYQESNLQQYVIFYCQDIEKGGLWDKPGKNRDIYHTCYALSGLSASQELTGMLNNSHLEPINPIYNITKKSYHRAKLWFDSLQQM